VQQFEREGKGREKKEEKGGKGKRREKTPKINFTLRSWT